jgi:hypothetical protein
MAVIFMGINDVGNSYWDYSATPIDDIQDEYFDQLSRLYDAGIKYFTLFTVPRKSSYTFPHCSRSATLKVTFYGTSYVASTRLGLPNS